MNVVIITLDVMPILIEEAIFLFRCVRPDVPDTDEEILWLLNTLMDQYVDRIINKDYNSEDPWMWDDIGEELFILFHKCLVSNQTVGNKRPRHIDVMNVLGDIVVYIDK